MHVSNTKDLILRYQNTPQQTIIQDFNIHYFQIYHLKKKRKKTMLLKQVIKKKNSLSPIICNPESSTVCQH